MTDKIYQVFIDDKYYRIRYLAYPTKRKIVEKDYEEYCISKDDKKFFHEVIEWIDKHKDDKLTPIKLDLAVMEGRERATKTVDGLRFGDTDFALHKCINCENQKLTGKGFTVSHIPTGRQAYNRTNFGNKEYMKRWLLIYGCYFEKAVKKLEEKYDLAK